MMILFFLVLFVYPFFVDAEEPQDRITVDLRRPVYSEGVLTTQEGGVISGPNLRIQAMCMTYHRLMGQNPPIHTILAEGELMVEFGDYIFVGQSLEYDFETKTGIITNGRTMIEPWFFGGKRIYLYSDGSYFIECAFATTSQNYQSDWEILAQNAHLTDDHFLTADNVRFEFFELPVFWLPTFKANLDTIFDGPVRYNIKWGGNQGHRFGLVYEIFSWNRLKTFLRLDYRLKYGLGGGLESYYRSEDRKTYFETINYAAHDSAIIYPHQHIRYRFQGKGRTLLMDDKISVKLSYDKLSDLDMATDYEDRGLELETAGRTELLIRRQETNWISNLITRVRLNGFQTINQELPTLETSWRPFELAETGIISENMIKASYLNFAYGDNQINVHDYNSPRFELAPVFYRPFTFGKINAVPEVSGMMIAYGDSPHREGTKWLTLGKFALDVNTSLYRHYANFKHVITPYVNYQYLTMPSVLPNNHYIFDIEDGWYRLNMMTLGFSQSLYQKHNGCVNRECLIDLYANAFFDTPTFPAAIPKVYADLVFNSMPCLRHVINSAWDFNHNELDHYNVRTEWTVSADVAIALEYRHRSPWDWRKVDHTNFIIDAYRSLDELYHSLMSDRRDTLLTHLFYRFHPSWAFEFESRHGWNRRSQPPYNEFEIDLIGSLRSAWNVKLSYQHKEDDDRVSFYTSIGINRPDTEHACQLVPCLSY